MASLRILIFVTLSNVVLAFTTSCFTNTAASATPQLPGKPRSWIHTRFENSTTASWAKHSDTARLISHQPWTGNVSRTVAPYTASVPRARPTATVTVGRWGELVFSPSSINASAGSIVAFNFLGLNHTLTESELRDPCQSNGGFDTGFTHFNPANVSGKFVIQYEVTDEIPRWFFCAQTARRPHCQAGMIFSLNPGGRQVQFLENALAAAASPTPTATACHVLVSGTEAYHKSNFSQSTGTGSAGLAASSAVISPLISNNGKLNRVPYVGMVLALAMI